MFVGEYLNWTEGNAIVPYENPRHVSRMKGACSLHQWFQPGLLRCTYCGVSVYCSCGGAEVDLGEISCFELPKRQAALDHLIPRSRGGGHDANNVAVACRSCSSSKKD
ncbi:HNH endonuclease [Streptomyces sp. NPDC051662]|uniref:HNH endonuclease n=1 Tax=Streptomyces sp. NPDC051662 TaxID=3154750 RepID=UPI003445FE97